MNHLHTPQLFSLTPAQRSEFYKSDAYMFPDRPMRLRNEVSVAQHAAKQLFSSPHLPQQPPPTSARGLAPSKSTSVPAAPPGLATPPVAPPLLPRSTTGDVPNSPLRVADPNTSPGHVPSASREGFPTCKHTDHNHDSHMLTADDLCVADPGSSAHSEDQAGTCIDMNTDTRCTTHPSTHTEPD